MSIAPNDLPGMIRSALNAAGGVEYLTRQAEQESAGFIGLVGRALATELAVDSSDSPLPDRIVIELIGKEG